MPASALGLMLMCNFVANVRGLWLFVEIPMLGAAFGLFAWTLDGISQKLGIRVTVEDFLRPELS